MSTFYLKYRDTLPTLEATLLKPDLTAYSLASITSVVMHIYSETGTTMSRYCSIYNSTGGVVRYTFKSTDWTAPGLEIGQSLMEFEALTTGTTRLTFPNANYDTLSIISDIENGIST